MGRKTVSYYACYSNIITVPCEVLVIDVKFPTWLLILFTHLSHFHVSLILAAH